MKEVLLSNVETFSDHPLFSQGDIDKKFMKEIRKCSKFFKDIQTKAILSNIESFDLDIDKMHWRYKKSTLCNSQIRELRKKVADEFILRYNIQPIRNDQRIVPITTASVKKEGSMRRWLQGGQSAFFSLGCMKLRERKLILVGSVLVKH